MESSSKVGPPQKAEGITCLCNPLTELFFTVQNNFILSSFFLKLFWVEHLSSFKAVEPKVIFKGASSAKQANNQTKKVRQYKTGLCETRASWGLCGGTGWDMLLWLTWPVFSSYRLLLKLCTGRQNVQCLPNSFGYLLGGFTWVLVSLPTKWGCKHRPTCLMEEIVLLKDGGSYWRVTCQVLIMRLLSIYRSNGFHFLWSKISPEFPKWCYTHPHLTYLPPVSVSLVQCLKPFVYSVTAIFHFRLSFTNSQ